MRTGAQAGDVERDDLHGEAPPVKLRMLSNIGAHRQHAGAACAQR